MNWDNRLLQMMLSEYDIEYRSQKPIKGSVLADHLAHQPIEDYQSVQYDFPDEEILYLKEKDCAEPLLEEGPELGSRWGMVFDGAVNQYGNGIGAVIDNSIKYHAPTGTRFWPFFKQWFITTFHFQVQNLFIRKVILY